MGHPWKRSGKMFRKAVQKVLRKCIRKVFGKLFGMFRGRFGIYTYLFFKSLSGNFEVGRYFVPPEKDPDQQKRLNSKSEEEENLKMSALIGASQIARRAGVADFASANSLPSDLLYVEEAVALTLLLGCLRRRRKQTRARRRAMRRMAPPEARPAMSPARSIPTPGAQDDKLGCPRRRLSEVWSKSRGPILATRSTRSSARSSARSSSLLLAAPAAPRRRRARGGGHGAELANHGGNGL